MPLFKYKAMDNKGKRIQGEFSANNKNEVLAMIRENDYYPLYVEEKIQSKELELGSAFSKIKTKDLAVFCRQFATLHEAGSDILNSVNLLRKQSTNKKMRDSLDVIYEDIQKGSTLSSAMKKYEDVYPKLLVNMIESGEETGSLGTILERMAEQYEKDNKINGKIKGALIYPIILLIAAIGVVTFLLTFVMPTFMTMFEGSNMELPGPTKAVIGLSAVLKNYWYMILIVIMLFILGIRMYGKTTLGARNLDKLKLNFPLIRGTNRKIVTLRFARGLSTILYSGVTMVNALEIVSKVLDNKMVEDLLMQVREKVVKGIPLNEALEHIEIFPPMVISMIKIGEESGSLDDILEKTARFYDQEVEEALSKMTAMVEPILILVVGLLVGFIVIAMLMPMFDMYNAI
ncbi:type II secretion system F family protein [Clostridium ganghwense]|uniref:Type II secretion system F family protein n=1 Tax=Clostridium ganghwense TaxID=312089 RepID=A0ABT4CPD6_9CLOT|nr:type II secretion system F family protein [Clostridium ganghwense]MCY6370913.1 type II secretion system F family protein [Clostridium ganghwense]